MRQPGRPTRPAWAAGLAAMLSPVPRACTRKRRGCSGAPTQLTCRPSTCPCGAISPRARRKASGSGTRLAMRAIRARSSRSALSSPPSTGWAGWPGATGWVFWRQRSDSWLAGQLTSSSVVKRRPSAFRLSPSAVRVALSRAWILDSASGSRALARRRLTSSSATSRVAWRHSPSARSIHRRRAPSPARRSKGRSTWRRRLATSARGRLACRLPDQRCQSPARASSGWLKRPTRLKRSPQAGGGVASRRRSWSRRPLRTTRSVWLSTSGGASRNSSTQRTVAWRITNSRCWKNQSVPAPLPWLTEAELSTSRPATCRRPWRSRRTSSWAPSM